MISFSSFIQYLARSFRVSFDILFIAFSRMFLFIFTMVFLTKRIGVILVKYLNVICRKFTDEAYRSWKNKNSFGDLCIKSLFRFMEPLTSKIPLMVIEGNHEIEPQVDGIKFQSYLTRFAVPSEESHSKSKFYYSFNAGGIHFIMLGAYIDYNRTGN